MADEGDLSSSSDSEENQSTEANPFQVAAAAGARLNAPEKADISRPRKVLTNPNGKRNVRGAVDPNVSAWEKVKESKGEYLTAVSGNLLM